MKTLKVLHIVNWFPNNGNAKEAIWIARHIDAIEPYTETNEILHIQVIPGTKFKIENQKKNNLNQIIWRIPLKSWYIVEIVTFLILSKELLQRQVNNNYSLINFHIAYPLLCYYHLFKKFITIPIVISEHWSAYHFNFGVQKKLPRIQKIFRQDLPVLTVSESLINDIRNFSENEKIKNFIVPNIVDTGIFNHQAAANHDASFFMISQWKWPKNPNVILDAFAIFLLEFKTATLRIGGYGHLYPQMQKKVKDLCIEENVCFLGTLSSEQIAEEMNKASAFLHCSEYETFSVVCAEALCCGCPVVASEVGGIVELVNKSNGILLENNNVALWIEAFQKTNSQRFNRHSISNEAIRLFEIKSVGLQYFNILKLFTFKNKKSTLVS